MEDTGDNEKELKEIYKLSEEEHSNIYKIIKEIIFNNVRSIEFPRAVIVGAQPRIG